MRILAAAILLFPARKRTDIIGIQRQERADGCARESIVLDIASGAMLQARVFASSFSESRGPPFGMMLTFSQPVPRPANVTARGTRNARASAPRQR